MPTISLGDATYAYDVHGRGEPLLLLHGALVSRAYWQREVAIFSKYYQVITCDLRGHGDSSRSAGPYSVSQFTRDVASLIGALGLGRVVCCGHSLGGMVAQELAASYPDLVRGLVLADTWYDPRGLPWEPFPFRTVALKWMLYSTSVDQMANLMARGLGMFNTDIGPYVRAEVGRHMDDRANYISIWDAAIDFDGTARLYQIVCPTLIMTASYFPYTLIQGMEMQRRIRDASVITIPRAGHWLNWDNPAAFDQALAGFLRQGTVRGR